MPSAAKWWTFGDAKGLNEKGQYLMGGNDGTLLERENLSFCQTGALVQRFGSQAQSLTSSGFTGIVEWGARHTTTGGLEERWAVANNAGTAALARRATGMWTPVSFSDTVTVQNLRYMQAASLTTKFFIAYDSDVNRLHVWDAATQTLRRVGFAQSVAPSAAEMSSGSNSFTRYYRQRYVELSADGETTIRRSEPSNAVSVTIASKLGVTVTKAAALNEGETHWEVEAASAEVGPWYRIAQVAVAVTTYNDTGSTIDDSDPSAIIGEYVPPPSCKYILSDTNRILLAGAWESAASSDDQTPPKQNRVWYTPVLGTTDEGDDERIPNTVDQQNYVDIGNEGPITGLAGPLYGDIYVLKSDSIFKLTPTGDFVTPYRVVQLTAGIGAVDQRTIAIGELGTGTPAIFFASSSSVYAITSGGVVELSDDVSRDMRMTNFQTTSSWLAYDPYAKALRAQTNSGMSATAGQYYQFEMDLKAQQWSGVSLGGQETAWVLGRSILGTSTILGGGGAEIRNAFVAQNDNGSVRLILCGQNSSAASQMLSAGDVCGVDGSTAFTSKLRIRKFPTPGHHFTVGAPTIVYRNPVGTSGAVGTFTLSYLNQNAATVSQSIALTATDQDDPLDQVMVTLDGIDHNVTVLDVRATLSHDISYATALPACIDAILIPITEKETYAQ